MTVTPEQLDALWTRLDSGDAAGVIAELGGVDTPPALTLRGLARYDAGAWTEALVDLRRVLELQPENPVAHATMALVLFRLGRREDAAHALGAMPLFPQGAFLRRFMELFWPLHLADMGPRRLCPSGTVKDLPHSADFSRWQAIGSPQQGGRVAALHGKHVQAASRLYQKGDITGARKLFERALQLVPTSPEAGTSLGHCLLREGRAEQAYELMEPAMAETCRLHEQSKDPADLPDHAFLVQYAWCLHERGDHRGALAALSIAHPEGPDDFLAHLVAALSWMMLGERDKATPNFEKAFGAYFIESWELVVHPFVNSVIEWLRQPEAPAEASE